MDASKLTITKIFDRTEKLEIPFFQRSYVWKEEQWERLYADMTYVSNNQRPYFLGSIILKATPSIKGEPLKRIVIDGQQRLTTLPIFFKVYCLKTNNNAKFDHLFRLFTDQSFPIIHNAIDSEAFDCIMNITTSDQSIYDSQTTSILKKNNGVVQCFNYFMAELNPDEIQLDVLLSNLLFVGINLSIEEDEQQIFDTINSLGVNLTTAELLKNYFFGKNQYEHYVEYWMSVFENNEQDREFWEKKLYLGRFERSIIDIFFYAFLQIKVQEANVSSSDKLDFSRVDKLFTSYKRFIKEYLKDDKSEILKQIKDYAVVFKKNFNPDIINQTLKSQSGVDRINGVIFGLDSSTILPYVLFVLKNQPNEEVRSELFHTIEAYILRRIITRASNKAYNRLFSQTLISNKALDKDSFIETLIDGDDSTNGIPSDSDLEQAFHQSKLDNKTARGVLYFIESKLRSSEKHALLIKGMNDYSLEHLMPKKWRNKWDESQNPLERDTKVLSLGNLAIINGSLNTAIKDSDWDTKKRGSKKDKGLQAYSSGLITLGKYLNLDHWNEDEISKRSNDLYESFISVYGSYSKGIGNFEVDSVKDRIAKTDKAVGIIQRMQDYSEINPNIVINPTDSTKSYIRFTTKIITKLLPYHEDSYKYGFKNEHQIMYEIALTNNSPVYVVATLAQGAGDYNKEAVNQLIDVIKENKLTHRRRTVNKGGWLWLNRWQLDEVFNVEAGEEHINSITGKIITLLESDIATYEQKLLELLDKVNEL